MDFNCKIEEGKLSFAPSVGVAFAKYRASHEGIRLVITEWHEERSGGQLRLYRAWLSSVAAQTGNDPEELHAFLLDRCAPRAVVKIKGPKGDYEMEQIKRTSGGHSLSMDKLEMSEFMDRCAVLTGHPLPTEEELLAMGYLPR